MSDWIRPSPEAVKALREETGQGLMECKKRLQRERMLLEVNRLRYLGDKTSPPTADFDRLLDIVETILRETY